MPAGPAAPVAPVVGGAGGGGGDPDYAYDIGAFLGEGGTPSSGQVGAMVEQAQNQGAKEAQVRQSKTIIALKQELTGMLQVYGSVIPAMASPRHRQQHQVVMNSPALSLVRKHHAEMQRMIKNYYKTAELKVGVIVSAEQMATVMGGKSKLPGMGGDGYSVNKHGKTEWTVKKGVQEIMRGGINSKRVIENRLPTLRDVAPRATRVQGFLRRDDHPHPEVPFRQPTPYQVTIRTGRS
tara:strand:- start:898 stop:1608 length:711 start_codon:yes stop_codon:yes gene_type:complete